MPYVMVTVLIFSIPSLLIIASAHDVKTGKRDRIAFKWPVLLHLALAAIGLAIQLYYQQAYHFPFFQTETENWVVVLVVGVLAGIILLVNIIITLTSGKNFPKSIHDPKAVNYFIIGIVLSLSTILLIAVPTAKKMAFSHAINKAIEASDEAQTEDFPVVLITSERECLKNTSSCRNSPYSNQFFVRNNLDKTQEVQVKIRALNSSGEEMKVIDSHIMTLQPGELRLVKTEETNETSSPWNQYSFQTDSFTGQYEYWKRHRDPK